MPFDFSPENLDREFPVRRNLVYFNHAAVGALPRRVADAITAHVENARDRGAADWRLWYSDIDATRRKAADFLGGHPSEIAILPSTSWALNVVARAFPWREGDNVVGDDLEFSANVFPWMMLADRGVEYRLTGSRDGRITVDHLAGRVDGRTRVVSVSHVAFHNGWVFPLEEIGEFCREKGILFVVDAIQGLGALPLDVSTFPVDVVAADAHKWLLGPEGCTIFWVSENARERLPPVAAGWWNVKTDWHDVTYELDFHLGARRYEPGSLPTALVRGLSASLDLLTEMGIETIHERILATVAALADGLATRGWTIASPRPLASGILAAVPPRGDSLSVEKELETRGVIVSARRGAVRFSPHAYNDATEVERVLEAVGEAVKTG